MGFGYQLLEGLYASLEEDSAGGFHAGLPGRESLDAMLGSFREGAATFWYEPGSGDPVLPCWTIALVACGGGAATALLVPVETAAPGTAVLDMLLGALELATGDAAGIPELEAAAQAQFLLRHAPLPFPLLQVLLMLPPPLLLRLRVLLVRPLLDSVLLCWCLCGFAVQLLTVLLLFLEVGFTGGGERCAAEACALPLPKTRVSWTALQASLTLQLLKVLLLQFPLVLLPQAALGEPHWLEDGARGIGRTSTPEPSNDEEELGADIGWTLDSADGGLTMASRLRRVVA